jgi:hypothetical protein
MDHVHPPGTPDMRRSRWFGIERERDELHMSTWVANSRSYSNDTTVDSSNDAGDRTRFFCTRFGSVLVACGKTFRVSACLPGTPHAAPDMQHLHDLHRARAYSPTTACMVLDDSQAPGNLLLLLHIGEANGSTSRWSIKAPADQQISACQLSPDGAWLVIGTDRGEVWLADVAGALAAATDATSTSPAGKEPGAAGATNGSTASAAAATSPSEQGAEMAPSADSAAAAAAAGDGAAPASSGRPLGSLPLVKLGSHGRAVSSCAVHPSSCYAATCR